MRKLILLSALVLSSTFAQQLTRANVAQILDFEDSSNGRLSGYWGAVTNPEIAADDQVAHSGKYSARITRAATDNFTTIAAAIPQDFRAERIELRGFVKLENVEGNIALWLRQDGPAGTLAFATLQPRNIRGTADWEEYSIEISLQPNGRQIVFGFFVSGAGRGWADSLQLLADGKPVAQAPDPPVSVLVTDREFDSGSRINVTGLTDMQVANLATLCKIWGFLKYHHPFVTAGNRHSDYELLRIMPAVLGASNTVSANAAMHDWILRLGPVNECAACPTLRTDGLQLAPDLDWMNDQQGLGAELSETLRTIYTRRSGPNQFYIRLQQNRNPRFENELNYPQLRHPDSGFQLLALFRFWNMMQYFNPNRAIMRDNPGDNSAEASAYWSSVLKDSLRRFAVAQDRRSYQQALLLLIASVNDTHANLYSGLASRPPLGDCVLPIELRFIEGQLVVYRTIARDSSNAGPLQVGDVITHLEGANVIDRVNEWRPYYAASNEPTRLRDMARYLPRGACGPAQARVRRGVELLDLTANRVPASAVDSSRSSVHDLPGPVFQKLADDIAYLKLSGVRSADSASYVRQAEGARGLIIDIRNYPSEFVVFSLGQLFVNERTTFVRFTEADLSNPGAFHWSASVTLIPQQPRYTGEIVILIDETTQSQAEYTTMAFRSAPGSVVLGSTTAGADGDVSLIELPGAQTSYISGLGVYYPDGRPTQRIGILPDYEVSPTIEGIRAGRDELIEEAIRIIRGQ